MAWWVWFLIALAAVAGFVICAGIVVAWALAGWGKKMT